MLNRTRFITVCFMVAVMVLASFLTSQASSQADKKETKSNAKAEKRTTRDASDPNVKSEDPDPNNKPIKPPQKGGEKTRGGTCQVHIDNNTDYYVTIFLDGYKVGYVSPYGDAYGYYSSGEHTLYGNSRDYTFGPKTFYCGSSYTWHLTE